MPELAAIVLCGGASRRMGRDKALLSFGSETILQRVVRIVATVADPVIVVASPNQELPELPANAIIARDVEEYQGPLVAFKRGVDAVCKGRPIFACACDMPHITVEVIAWLASLYRPGFAVVPVISGKRQPLAAIYPPEVRSHDVLPNQSMQSLLDQLSIIEVTTAMLLAAGQGDNVFAGINNPDEYRQACD